MEEQNSPIGDRIRELRDGRQNQPDFAYQLGVSLSTLRRYEGGDRLPDSDFLIAVRKKLGVSPLWVLTGEEPKYIGGGLQGAGSTEVPGSNVPVIAINVGKRQYVVDPVDYRWIPFYDVEFGAGGGRVVDFARPPKKFNAYRRDYLQDRGLLEADLFEATVIGDSQYPEIFGGDVIMVNASDRSITSGEIYVIQLGDEWICKYLRRLPEGKIEVYSKNDELHKPFMVSEELLGNSVEIIGRVVRQGRDR